MIRVTALLLLVFATGTAAQTPDTEIYLAPLRLKDGWVTAGAPINITNRPGYDNQPHFTRDGRSILYTAGMQDGQTEIWRYDIASRNSVQLTRTPESEYSPTPMASGFSVVRVERDSTQRLWRFDAHGANPRLLLPGVEPVGYHAWLQESKAALFVLGTPATLRIVDLRTGQADSAATDIGRAIQKIPGWNGVSFVQRMEGNASVIRRINAATGQVYDIARALEGAEYHAWGPRGSLMAASGSRIYEWTPINGGEWRVAADYSSLGLRISRIAVSPRGNWIALVGERATR